MEQHLQDQLLRFNRTKANKYRDCWGSTLSYLSPSSVVNGKKCDEVSLFLMLNKEADNIQSQREKILADKEKYLLINKYGSSRQKGGKQVPKSWKEAAKLDTMEKLQLQTQHNFTKIDANLHRLQEKLGGDMVPRDKISEAEMALPGAVSKKKQYETIEHTNFTQRNDQKRINMDTFDPSTLNNTTKLGTIIQSTAQREYNEYKYQQHQTVVTSGRKSGDSKEIKNTLEANLATANTTMMPSQFRRDKTRNKSIGTVQVIAGNVNRVGTSDHMKQRQLSQHYSQNTKTRPQTSYDFNAITGMLSNMRGDMSNSNSGSQPMQMVSSRPDQNSKPVHNTKLTVHEKSLQTMNKRKDAHKKRAHTKMLDGSRGQDVPDGARKATQMMEPQQEIESQENKSQKSLLLSDEYFNPDEIAEAGNNFFNFEKGNRLAEKLQLLQPQQIDKSAHRARALQNAKGMLCAKLGGLVTNKAGFGSAASNIMYRRESQQMHHATQQAARTQSQGGLPLSLSLSNDYDENYVNQNSIKGVHMIYKEENQPLSAKADNVFKLQKTMRLATKFYGAQTQKGMRANVTEVKKRAETQNFREQSELVHRLKAESKNRVGDYIDRELSIKQRVHQAMQNERKDVQIYNSPTLSLQREEPVKSFKDEEDKDCVFENPKQIKKENSLLLSMVKHQELQKIAVSDTFSKKADPIDQYYELQKQGQHIREQQQIQDDIKKQIKDKMSKITSSGSFGKLFRKPGEHRAQVEREYRDMRGKQKKPVLLPSDTVKIDPKEIPFSVLGTDRNKYDKVRDTPRMFESLQKGDDYEQLFPQNQRFFYSKDAKAQPKQANNKAYRDKLEQIKYAIDTINQKNKVISPSDEIIQKMPVELRALLSKDPNEQNKLFRLQGYNQVQFLKSLETKLFMQAHKFSTEKLEKTIENIQFSKQFFEIMDGDGGGAIELEELATPLIAFGLATDTGFVQKALKVLNPIKYGQGQFSEALTLKEFSRIFRTDPVSEKLIKLIYDQLKKNTDKQRLKIQMMKKVNSSQNRYSMMAGAKRCCALDQGLQNLGDDEQEEYEQEDPEQIYSLEGNQAQLMSQDGEDPSNQSNDDLMDEGAGESANRNRFRGNPLEHTSQPTSFQNKDFQRGVTIDATALQMQQTLGSQPQHQNQGLHISKQPTSTGNDKDESIPMYDINDQVNIVKQWWKKIQQNDLEWQIKQEKGRTNSTVRQSLPVTIVAKQFLQWNVFQDLNSAEKYLYQAIGEANPKNKEKFDYDDFLAVFIKGIFKDVVCGIARTVSDFKRKGLEEPVPDQSLFWTLSDYRRENLFEMVQKGMIKQKDDIQQIVTRPILSNLYNLKYRSDPETWKNADYDKFLFRTVHNEPKVQDQNKIQIDSFNDSIKFIQTDFKDEVDAYNQLIASGENQFSFQNDMELSDIIKAKQKEQKQKDKKLPLCMTVCQQIKNKIGCVIKEDVFDEQVLQAKYLKASETQKQAFNLNHEKTEFKVARPRGIMSLIDGVSQNQKEEQEKKLVQDFVIKKHVMNDKMMKQYEEKNGPGLRLDELSDFNINSYRSNDRSKVELFAEGSDQEKKAKLNNANITIEDIRKERKLKHNLLEQMDYQTQHQTQLQPACTSCSKRIVLVNGLCEACTEIAHAGQEKESATK